MHIRETTRTIIRLVEEHSGFPVQVVEEPGLATFAVVRMARKGIPGHILAYRPVGEQVPDYLIA